MDVIHLVITERSNSHLVYLCSYKAPLEFYVAITRILFIRVALWNH